MPIYIGSQPLVKMFVGTTEVTKVYVGGQEAYSSGPAVPITAVFFGQSEIDYLFNAGSFYRQISQPAPGDGNLVVYTQGNVDAAPVRTVVNPTTVAAGEVNPAMSALSAFLAHAAPGKTFIVGDTGTPGTSRYELVDDADADRKWSDLAAVVSAIETEAGAPLNTLIECWYNSDAGSINTFKNSFWPLYFGRTGADGAFTLGNTNPAAANTAAIFDHCLWDGAAATDAKGRGLFARDDTTWQVLTPMPFHDAPDAPDAERSNYSEGAPRLCEPSRDTMIGLGADALAQSVGLTVGPSVHICRFGNGSSLIHPDVATADGQILMLWPFALALLRAAGATINEPSIVGIEGPDDGSYVELLVDLPNGGTLTTLRALRSAAAPDPEPPHYQPVVGFEISRGSTRRPVFKTSETSYPADYRGTVEIQDAGSGTPRRGRVRITPTSPFTYGNSVSYLRGQATGVLLEPRDLDALLYQDMLIEHVPALYDADATYPCEGVAVRPYQAELSVTVPAPDFSPQSTSFNGTTSKLQSTALSVAGASEGTMGMWLYFDGTWNVPSGAVILQLRVGTTIVAEIKTASSNRMTVSLVGATAFTTPVSSFSAGQFAHLAVSYKTGVGGWFQVCINGGAPLSGTADLTAATLSINNTVTRCYVGASGGASAFWPGDLAYIFADLQHAIDLSVQENREKFILAGAPVDLGANGQLVTGSQPAIYLDGGAAMSNLGYGGALTATDLAAGATPHL